MNLTEAWNEDLLSGQYSPSKTNRASMMGRNCIRRLYYERMHPEEKTPFTEQALGFMREGTEQEKTIRKHLMELGFDIARSQEPFEFKDLQLTGHWEGVLLKGKDYPKLFEIKTCNQWKFDQLHSIDNFHDGKWWEGYLKQATVYMKAADVDKILFIVKDRSSWRINDFEYEFDNGTWNAIRAKCDTLNGLIEDKSVPHDILCCNFSECDSCPFENFCCPDRVISHEGWERINNPDVEAQFTSYIKLKEKAQQYEKVKEEIRCDFAGRDAFIGDKFEISNKLISVKENLNPKPKKGYKYWSMKIKEL